MQSETRNCQNCKNDFTIEPEDFSFYEKIKVPPPTFCPECRMVRRMAWRNNRSLFPRSCGLCAKKIISYLKEDGAPVYCASCYAGDGWDQYQFAKDYDFQQNFFTQFSDLLKKQPRLFQITYGTVVNCDYSNSVVDGKNIYLTFSTVGSENIFFSENVDKSKDCFDCLSVQELSQCSWNINSERNYNSHFTYESENCIDSYFLFDCANCSNCFMSSNLRNQSYYFYNEKLDKETYLQKVSEISTSKNSSIEKLKKDFDVLIKNSLHQYANIQASQNATGDIILNSKDVKNSFDIRASENIKFGYRTISAKDLMDCCWILKGEMEYESMTGSGGSYKQISCFMCVTSKDMFYSIACKNSSDCFGCVGLKNAQYCILNKQYSKESYYEMIDKIKSHMLEVPYVDDKGRVFKYGEFFPYRLSFIGYNESLAHDFFPITKDKAMESGFNWFERQDRGYTPTIKSADLPDDISDVTDDIINHVIACPGNGNPLTQCTVAYKIIQEELRFSRQKKLPLPRLCPNCRHYERLAYRNPTNLWHRKCICENVSHASHKGSCEVEFETTYDPDRPEKVYCEKCYQQEVY